MTRPPPPFSRLTRVVVALAAMVAGAATTAGLLLQHPGADPLPALLAGGMVMLGGSQLYQILARRRLEQRHAAEVAALREELARRPADDLRSALAEPLPEPAPASLDTPLMTLAGAAAPADEATADEEQPELLAALQAVLDQGRLDVALQPVVSLPERKHCHYEVLPRLPDRQGRALPLGAVLAAARRRGLLMALDHLLLQRCLQLIDETERRGHPIGFFAHLTPASLTPGPRLDQLLGQLGPRAQARRRLVLALGQTAWEHGGSEWPAGLERLSHLGCHFALDQVHDLATLEPGRLSAEGFRFVKVPCTSLLAADSAAAVAGFKRRLEARALELIVDQVDTEAQLTALARMPIDLAQGIQLGEPRLARRPAPPAPGLAPA